MKVKGKTKGKGIPAKKVTAQLQPPPVLKAAEGPVRVKASVPLKRWELYLRCLKGTRRAYYDWR